MLENLHTHSTFCDGKNTPEETVCHAMERGFDTLGFSGHGYTPYDTRYCMKDTEGYIQEILRLKEKYKGRLRILLGVEEDAFAPVDRTRFDYILGSCHYLFANGEYLPIDSSKEHLERCLAACHGDAALFAESYYEAFCTYIKKRKPDIIGHFDLITKFDDVIGHPIAKHASYLPIAKKYALEAARSACVFEVNTGAIVRGLRTTPYPAEELLYVLKKENARLILSSDCHLSQFLDGYFRETKQYLYDIGFRTLYTLTEDGFAPFPILS